MAARAALPLVLFVLAATPRLWAPDLVPYGERQAAHLADAARHSAAPWLTLYARPELPLLALLAPWLARLPDPVMGWVVVRGLLDAAGVALLFLAARPVAGVAGAGLAALLYAASPTAWAAARDPAGPLGPALAAASLLAAGELVRRPTPLRGALLGLTLGLLARDAVPGWAVVLAGAAALAAGRASWRVGGMAALVLAAVGGPALWAPAWGSVSWPLTPLAALQAPGRLVQGNGYAPPGGYPPGAHPPADLDVPIQLLALGLTATGLVAGLRAGGRAAALTVVAAAWALPLVLGVAAPAPGVGPVAALSPLALLAGAATLGSVRWVRPGWLAGLLLLGLTAGALGVCLVGAEAAGARSVAFRPNSGDTVGVVGVPAEARPAHGTLREWEALADALRETTTRIGAAEAVIAGDGPLAGPDWLAGLGVDSPALRRVGDGVDVLPLARETVYLSAPGAGDPDLPVPPSSSTAVVTPSGADTGLRLLTLRPRPLADWLLAAREVPSGRFGDGSTLVGVARRRDADGRSVLALFWTLPTGPGGVAVGARVEAVGAGAADPTVRELALPDPAVRRSGEVVVTRVALPEPSASAPGVVVVRVTLLDERGRAVAGPDGVASLDVPLGDPIR